MDSSHPLYTKVKSLLAEALDVPADQITPELAFGGIKQWDSMGHMGIMLCLEERLGIPIDADMIANLISVPAICEHLSKVGGEQ